MKLIDNAAAVAAMKYSKGNVVTVYVHNMTLQAATHIGNLLQAEAKVVFTNRDTMDVEVKVEAQDIKTGKSWKVSDAVLVFVAVNDTGTERRPVPDFTPSTDEEKQSFKKAKERLIDRLRDEFKTMRLT